MRVRGVASDQYAICTGTDGDRQLHALDPAVRSFVTKSDETDGLL
ncbi:MAG: hypothetical protein WD645_01915 [Dehalococcoidia bacterium]